MKKIIFVVCLISSIFVFSECSDCRKNCSIIKSKFKEGAMSIEIPFDNSNNIILVKGKVNDSEDVFLILDTGATATLFDSSFAEKLKLHLEKKVSDSKREYNGFSNVKISFPGVEAVNQEGRVSDIRHLSQFAGQRIDGILGYDFIKDFVVEINYEKKYIRLHSPKEFLYEGQGKKTKLEIRKKWPVGEFTLVSNNSEALDTLLIYDTGSMFSFSLNFTKLADKSLESSNSVGIAGIGQGGFVGRLKECKIAGMEVKSPLCAFPANDNPPADPLNAAIASVSGGIVGGQIMRKFNFVFDYSRECIYIEKNKNFDEYTEHDMSGLFIVCGAENLKEYFVAFVSDSSPASEAGIKANDKILSIDGKDSAKLSLWEVRCILSKENSNLEIKIEREGEIITSTLKLKRML